MTASPTQFVERTSIFRNCIRNSQDTWFCKPALRIRTGMSKLYSREELVAERHKWKSEGKKVVFTNGCYDILHPGHIRLLERARSLGDLLILALNTDASVQRLKGRSRPFFDEGTRAELALHLEAVDAVTLFEEETPRELIAAVLPDVLVKGA